MPVSEEWDLYTLMAMRFNWTPDQVDALDPDFMDALMARVQAQSRHDNKPRPPGK